MVRVSGMSSGLFSIQGSGMCQKASTVALAAANAASASVSRGGSAVAAISAGASTRIRNGLSMPPVRNSSASSSAIINASRPAACFGSSRRIGLKAICSTMLTVAENAMTIRHGISGRSKSRPCSTTKMVASCPSTASQRSRRIVSSRTCGRGSRKSVAASSDICGYIAFRAVSHNSICKNNTRAALALRRRPDGLRHPRHSQCTILTPRRRPSMSSIS